MAIVNIYQVTWRQGNDNHKHQSDNVDFVAAAPGTSGQALGSLIQTQNNDGRTVVVSHADVARTGVLQ
jgi:hypothetical protein